MHHPRSSILPAFFFLTALASKCLAADSGTCLLSLSVSPSNAAIRVDSALAGFTSLHDRPVKPGIHEIVISCPGFRSEKLVADIRSSTNIIHKLVPEGGFHRFRALVQCGYAPKEIIPTPDGRYLIITLMESSGLDIYGMEEGRIVRRIRPPEVLGGKGYVEGAFTADGREFWFTQLYTGTVYVMDYPSFAIKKTIAGIGNWPKVIEFTPGGEEAFASNWSGNDVAVIDTRSYKIIRRIRIDGAAPRNMAFTPDERYFYVTCFESGAFLKYAAASGRLVFALYTGGAPDRVRLDKTRRLAYFNNTSHNTLCEYEIARDRVLRSAITWTKPNNVRLSPDEEYIYVPCRGPNNPRGYIYPNLVNGRIQVFHRRTFALADEFEAGNQCVGMNITPNGDYIAFSNLQDSTIEIYSVERALENAFLAAGNYLRNPVR